MQTHIQSQAWPFSKQCVVCVCVCGEQELHTLSQLSAKPHLQGKIIRIVRTPERDKAHFGRWYCLRMRNANIRHDTRLRLMCIGWRKVDDCAALFWCTLICFEDNRKTIANGAVFIHAAADEICIVYRTNSTQYYK